jgi:hypothetical protein
MEYLKGIQMTTSVSTISELPKLSAVYALYGGQERNLYVAYVGIAESLRRRIEQHLVRRDSSVVTGTSAVGLNPDLVSEVRWWEHPEFKDRGALEAAELVAFEVCDPALRSRGARSVRAGIFLADPAFHLEMRSLFVGPETGRLTLPTLHIALMRIANLEQRIALLEEQLIRSSENQEGGK